MHTTAGIDWFRESWHPLVGLGLVVTLFAWIGLTVRRAPLSSYVRTPILAPVLVLGGLFLMTGVRWTLGRAAIHGALQAYLPLLVFPAMGFLFGWIGPKSRAPVNHRRGVPVDKRLPVISRYPTVSVRPVLPGLGRMSHRESRIGIIDRSGKVLAQ